MKTLKEILKPFYHWLVRLSKWNKRRGLKCTDFTIISNNCTGGYVYQYYGIAYKTPTEGLFFTTKDYLKLVERPEHYFHSKVILINPTDSTLAKKWGGKIHFPVGKIDDIEVYFMHYPDPQIALQKWYRRAARMNFNKLFFLLTETELATEEDITHFSVLMNDGSGSKKGICLMTKNRELPFTRYVPNVPKDKNNSNAAWRPEIIINSVNWIHVLNNL